MCVCLCLCECVCVCGWLVLFLAMSTLLPTFSLSHIIDNTLFFLIQTSTITVFSIYLSEHMNMY